MASGAWPAAMAAAMAAATGAPGSALARSPTSWTTETPYSPSTAALLAVSEPQATASTVVASERAAVSSSRVAVVGPASVASATTQILSIAIGASLWEGDGNEL